eukprot:NODE_3300_length_1004_cov_21.125654_g3034_i0.p1 GENE.NODE_3300_length_1004_cov_21.125654_g3034_i0~~NODE_3300_length_1004_cov_21.125654_g3034_i0.p1  ORF type:complete len:212 (+),score=39.54 NODE_3300_length_1004_cov_21.125654_g3034_i0:317-952(+)
MERFGSRNILSASFLRKYIMHARATCEPVLSTEAHAEVVEAYVELRQRMKNREISQRITPRSLESLVRLATAHAKMRLSNVVEKVDVEIVYNLMKNTLLMTSNTDSAPKRDRDGETSPGARDSKKPKAGASQTSPAGTPTEESHLAGTVLQLVRERSVIQLFELRDAVNEKLSGSGGEVEINTAQLLEVIAKLEAEDAILYEGGRVYLVAN